MLNKIISNKINYPEIRILYKSRMKITDRNLKEAIKEQVRTLRNEYKSKEIDPLQAKAQPQKKQGRVYQFDYWENKRLNGEI